MRDISWVRLLSNGHNISRIPVVIDVQRVGPVTSHDIHDTARRGGIRNQDPSVNYPENKMRPLDYVFNQFFRAILSWVGSHWPAETELIL
jgi:hypothetical protein